MLKTYANIAIDQIQEGKKKFVSTFVKNAPVAQIMNTFVDTQAEYTKAAMALSIDTLTSFSKLLINPSTYTFKK
jgi:phospholipase/lecithinase/hemolysin